MYHFTIGASFRHNSTTSSFPPEVPPETSTTSKKLSTSPASSSSSLSSSGPQQHSSAASPASFDEALQDRQTVALPSPESASVNTGGAVHGDSAPSPAPPEENRLRRLFTSWQQGVVASIGAVMGIGFLLFFLYTPVKEDTVHHTAVVASEALGDLRLKNQAIQLSKDVVLEVLRDPKSLDAVVEVVVQLLAREETKIAISSLLQSLFEDHYTQEVTKKFVLMVVQDPWIQEQLQAITKEQVHRLLTDPDVKVALSNYLVDSATESLQAPQLHYETARAVRHSVASLVNPWWH